MDMVYSAGDYCVWRVRRSIVETESVGDWQELHVLDEHAPTTGIIISAATAVGMNLTRLDHHCGISAYILRLILAGKSIGHAEGVAGGQQLLVYLSTRGSTKGTPAS